MNNVWKYTALGVLMLSVAACADTRTSQRATPPAGGDNGAFAFDGGKLHRLPTGTPFTANSPATWSERVSLGPKTRFVVQDEALAAGTADLQKRIRLVRTMHAQDVAYDVPGERSGGLPEWLVIDAAPTQPVPVTFDTYGDQYSGVVEVIPQQPLTPGMYALYVEGQETTQLGRFGVQWSEADRVAFDGNSCVTRVVNADVSYQACPASVAGINPTSRVAMATAAGTSAAARLPDSQGLEIRLLDPIAQTIGSENFMFVTGEITNTSDGVRDVPQVKVSLKDTAGNILREWEVAPQDRQLQPGTMTRFNANVSNPSNQAARIAATLE